MLSKKKLFNLVELIIQALLLISTFTIQSITMVSHSYSSTTVAKTSIIGYAVVSGAMFLVFIPIIIMFVNTILCSVSVFGNSADKDGKMHVALPISNLIYGFWIINAISADVNSVYKAFWIISLLIITILAIIKRTSFVVPKEEKQPQIINNIQEKSSADELKKFKELLDSGIISQEEFDEKKKQLLGL